MDNNYLSRAFEKAEQLRRRRRMNERKEQQAKRKRDFRRAVWIGELVCKHFPELLDLQPQQSRSENYAEYEPLERVLQWLSSNDELKKIWKGQ